MFVNETRSKTIKKECTKSHLTKLGSKDIFLIKYMNKRIFTTTKNSLCVLVVLFKSRKNFYKEKTKFIFENLK